MRSRSEVLGAGKTTGTWGRHGPPARLLTLTVTASPCLGGLRALACRTDTHTSTPTYNGDSRTLLFVGSEPALLSRHLERRGSWASMAPTFQVKTRRPREINPLGQVARPRRGPASAWCPSAGHSGQILNKDVPRLMTVLPSPGPQRAADRCTDPRVAIPTPGRGHVLQASSGHRCATHT